MNLATTTQFLRDNPNNYIELVRLDTQQSLPFDGNKGVYISDIPNENLEAYIKTYVNNNQENVTVSIQHRTKTGTSSRKIGNHYAIDVKGIKPEPQPTQNLPMQPQAAPVFLGNPQPAQYDDGLGAILGNPGLMLIKDLQVKADRYDEIKEQLSESKEEVRKLKNSLDDQKREFEKKIDIYDIDLRKANSDLATKDRELVMAVKEEKANQKSFFEGEAGLAVIEQVGAVVQAFSTKGAGGLGAAASPTKGQFINYVNSEFTDDQVVFLGTVIRQMPNQNFSDELTQLISKYATS